MEPTTHELQTPAACFLVARLLGFEGALPKLDPTDAARLLQDHQELLAYQVLRHGGEVVDRQGTRLVAFFGALGHLAGGAAPAEAAVRALRSALAMAEAIVAAGNELGQRIDMSIGVCEVGGGVELGVPVADSIRDTASRAMAVASWLSHPLASGPVLCTYGVLREVRGLFDVRALEPVPLGQAAMGGQRLPLYEVLAERRQGVRLAARKALGVETHLWAREVELGHMKALVHRAQQDRRPYGLLLEGELGAGKTRLAHELCRYATLLWPGSTLLWARCSQTGPAYELLVAPLRVLVRKVKSQGPELAATLQPSGDVAERSHFREVMTELLADRRRQGRRLADPQPPIPTDSEMAEIAEQSTLLAYLAGLAVDEEPAVRACSGDVAFLIERARRAAIAWLSALARRGPVIFVIEDLQNADAGSLQLLERTFDHAEGPILIVGIAVQPPESPGLRARLWPLRLGPLPATASSELLAQLATADRNGRITAQRAAVMAQGAGNPLVLEELANLVADGIDGPLPGSLRDSAALRVARLSAP
jgi:class 3 adenylate cyclase